MSSEEGKLVRQAVYRCNDCGHEGVPLPPKPIPHWRWILGTIFFFPYGLLLLIAAPGRTKRCVHCQSGHIKRVRFEDLPPPSKSLRFLHCANCRTEYRYPLGASLPPCPKCLASTKRRVVFRVA